MIASNFPRRALAATLIGAALLGASWACAGVRVTDAQPKIQDFINRVTTLDGSVVATLVTGNAPAAGSPAVTVYAPPAVIVGGSGQVTVIAADSVQKVIIAMENVSNYYELTLPATVAQTPLLFIVNQQMPLGTFKLFIKYGAVTGSKGVGQYSVLQTNVIQVGTGDIQVSVSWDSVTDIDLHVVDPNGDEVYYGQDSVASGGRLDLDSNAACNADYKNNENITWPSGKGLAGSYTVRLDYWSACTKPKTNYVVTIHTKNMSVPITYSGTFVGSGDGGGLGAGIVIGTFTF
jgi:hypothetical protein